MTLGNIRPHFVFKHALSFFYKCKLCQYEITMPPRTHVIVHECNWGGYTTYVNEYHANKLRVPYRDGFAILRMSQDGRWTVRLDGEIRLPHLDASIIRRVDDPDPGDIRLGATEYTDGWDDYGIYEVEAVSFVSLEEILDAMEALEDDHVLTYPELRAWIDELDLDEE